MADDSFSFPIDATAGQPDPAVERPYRRTFERVSYGIPVEITDRNGTYMIKARIMDVSPVAARVQFLRPPRLKQGDKVIVTIWKNVRTELAVSSFRPTATVFATRGKDALVLMFDDPRALAQEGFATFIYGPLLLASLNGLVSPNDQEHDRRVEALRTAARCNVDVKKDAGALRAERDATWRSHSYVRPSQRRER
ncbi:MAG TPA: PilZ domain-containing protein [Pantanalinema sp.]